MPPLGGCIRIAPNAFTMGAPANTIAMTTAGEPFAPKASRMPKAPIAPSAPAKSETQTPLLGKLKLAPWSLSSTSGASTAMMK